MKSLSNHISSMNYNDVVEVCVAFDDDILNFNIMMH